MIFAANIFSDCASFTLRHPGLLLVLIGVIGEVICDWKDMEGKLAKAKKLSAILLVVGLMMEFWEAAKSDEEIANTESKNLILQKELFKFKEWRTITPEDKARFIELTKNISKFPIRVRMSANASAEVVSYARKIRQALDAAGFIETNTDLALTVLPASQNLINAGEFPEMPDVSFLTELSTTSNIVDSREANQELKLLTNLPPTIKISVNHVDSDSPTKAHVVFSNGEPTLEMDFPSRELFRHIAFQQLQICFGEIGITTGLSGMNNVPPRCF